MALAGSQQLRAQVSMPVRRRVTKVGTGSRGREGGYGVGKRDGNEVGNGREDRDRSGDGSGDGDEN